MIPVFLKNTDYDNSTTQINLQVNGGGNWTYSIDLTNIKCNSYTA